MPNNRTTARRRKSGDKRPAPRKLELPLQQWEALHVEWPAHAFGPGEYVRDGVITGKPGEGRPELLARLEQATGRTLDRIDRDGIRFVPLL